MARLIDLFQNNLSAVDFKRFEPRISEEMINADIQAISGIQNEEDEEEEDNMFDSLCVNESITEYADNDSVFRVNVVREKLDNKVITTIINQITCEKILFADKFYLEHRDFGTNERLLELHDDEYKEIFKKLNLIHPDLPVKISEKLPPIQTGKFD